MKKIIEDIINYLNWLKKFTIDNPLFYDELSYKKLNEEDINNIKKLSLFFDMIYQYANKNYISSIPCDYGIYYRIKDDNIIYEIGVMTGQSTSFFCKRKTYTKTIEYIDINDIINNTTLSTTTNINNKFKEIEKIISSIYQQDNISLHLIQNKIDEIINDLSTKEETKTLTKRIN